MAARSSLIIHSCAYTSGNSLTSWKFLQEFLEILQRTGAQPSERPEPLVIIEVQLRALLKRLEHHNTMVPKDLSKAYNWTPLSLKSVSLEMLFWRSDQAFSLPYRVFLYDIYIYFYIYIYISNILRARLIREFACKWGKSDRGVYTEGGGEARPPPPPAFG